MPTSDQQLVQVVVAPHSPFVGDTIGSIDFRKTLGVVVVGMWRRQGWIREEHVAGAACAKAICWCCGARRSVRRARRASRLPDDGAVLRPGRAGGITPRARLLIVAAVVAAAASGVVPAQMAFLGGAVALVLTGCVSVEQAYREIDVRIFVMIAGVIPLGSAMEKTGTAALSRASTCRT